MTTIRPLSPTRPTSKRIVRAMAWEIDHIPSHQVMRIAGKTVEVQSLPLSASPNSYSQMVRIKYPGRAKTARFVTFEKVLFWDARKARLNMEVRNMIDSQGAAIDLIQTLTHCSRMPNCMYSFGLRDGVIFYIHTAHSDWKQLLRFFQRFPCPS